MPPENVRTPVSTILFDFFGTLVHYSASRTEQGYRATDQLLRDAGLTVGAARWLADWAAVCAELDERTATSHDEYSMADAARLLLGRVDLPPTDELVAAFVASYLAEWNSGVHHVDGVGPLIRELAQHHRLAVVTNTHDAQLVPDHLDDMGIADAFEVVVTSIEVGRRKPHPAIYHAALTAMHADAAETLFVGDSVGPDYLGPREAGMRALLIDPAGDHDVPDEHRLGSVIEVADRLGVDVSA